MVPAAAVIRRNRSGQKSPPVDASPLTEEAFSADQASLGVPSVVDDPFTQLVQSPGAGLHGHKMLILNQRLRYESEILIWGIRTLRVCYTNYLMLNNRANRSNQPEFSPGPKELSINV